MKKRMLLAGFCAVLFLAGKAQSTGTEYETAVGVKFYPGALSVKHFNNSNTAWEGLGYFWKYGFRATGLYEFHMDIDAVPGLKWYAGPGAHLGFWNNKWHDKYPDRSHGINIGIDGVLGLDYKFDGAPINISLDWQPSLNLVGYNYFEGGWGGLGIRFAF